MGGDSDQRPAETINSWMVLARHLNRLVKFARVSRLSGRTQTQKKLTSRNDLVAGVISSSIRLPILYRSSWPGTVQACLVKRE
jgi:hypothetical protein